MEKPLVTDKEYKFQQLSLPEVDGVENLRLELIERIIKIGELSVNHLVDLYQNAGFSFEDIVNYLDQQGRNRAEAGKVFTRFYNQLKNLGFEPPVSNSQQKYENNRDIYSYPLYLLSYVLMNSHYGFEGKDFYDGLLNDFHAYQVGQLLENKSTSA